MLVAIFVVPVHGFVYREMVPSTVELAPGRAHQVLPDDRPRFAAVVAEEEELPRLPPLRRHPILIRAHETLSPFTASTFQRSDVWIIPADRLDSPAAASFLEVFVEIPPEQILERGPRGEGPTPRNPQTAAPTGRYGSTLPGRAPGERPGRPPAARPPWHGNARDG